MDDPIASPFFDPSEEQENHSVKVFAKTVNQPSPFAPNHLLVGFTQPAKEDQPKDVDPTPLGDPKKSQVLPPRLPIQIEPIPSLGIVVIRATNPADLQATLDIIELLRRDAQPSLIQIELVPVRLGDPVAIVTTLNQLLGRVNFNIFSTTLITSPAGTVAQINPIGGTQTPGAGGIFPGGPAVARRRRLGQRLADPPASAWRHPGRHVQGAYARRDTRDQSPRSNGAPTRSK